MPLHGTHDPALVVLSYIVAVAASFGGLTLAERVGRGQGRGRVGWLTGGAITLGAGIWGMHFVGMMAFGLPVPVRYDLSTVTWSTVPAVLASGLALWLVGRARLTPGTYAAGSLAMGSGIVGMHYIGMAAMEGPFDLSYDPSWVMASIAIAVLASFSALWLGFRLRAEGSLRQQALRLGAAGVMGAAIAGMHYAGMAATVFTRTDSAAWDGLALGPPPDLVLGVSGGVMCLVLLVLALAFLERRSPQPSLFQLGMIMIAVPLGVGAATMTVLYRTLADQDVGHFADAALRQTALVAQLARVYGGTTALDEDSLSDRDAVAGALARALAGVDGDVYVLVDDGDDVSFLLPAVASSGGAEPLLTEPMRRALDGETGTLIGPDLEGSRSLFAYEAIPELRMAVVASAPLPDLRGTFIRTALFAAALTMGLVLAGLGLFVRLGAPLVERAEEGAFLDSVLEHAPQSWLVEDPVQGVIRVNRTFEETFRIPARAIEGKRREELQIGSDLLASFTDMELEARTSGHAVREFDFPTGDGGTIPVVATVGTAGGLAAGSLFWVFEDVTDRRAARDALVEGRRRAEEASRAKSAFLASMSHEIRTPMNGVMGMLELLLDTDLGQDQRRVATIASDSAETLLELLNQILDFSKIEAGAMTLESIPLDLESIVHDAARMLQLQASDTATEITVDVGEDVPPAVLGDPVRLRQIVTNLVSNAVKFTPGGDVRIAVEAVRVEGNEAEIVIRVADTGTGIPADKLEAIFEEFEQADSSTTRTHGGTGLGLAICRRLTHLMGGRIDVESTEGVGTTFEVRLALPLAPEGSGAHRAPVPVALGGRRLLIVDDSPTARMISSDALHKAGASVHEAASALEGFDLLLAASRAGHPFDAGIIDSMMPIMDGFELASRVHGHPELTGTRLLMLTSAAELDGHERARRHGIKGYLAKPVRRADLLLAVGSLLELRGPGEGPERRVITAGSLTRQQKPLRILLVEDSPVNRQVATSMLAKRGHRVDVACDGREGVDAFAAGAYDLVLMDVQMPVMDGLEATRRIRATPRGADVPIVALTAHALEDERARCLEAGMTDFLTKPYRSGQLYAVVEGWRHTPEPEQPAGGGENPVDIDGMRRALEESGIVEILGPTLEVYLEETPGRIQALQEALEDGALEEVSRGAHAMKSAAGTIHARPLADTLARLERVASEGDAAEVEVLGPEAVAQARAALGQIERYLRDVGSA